MTRHLTRERNREGKGGGNEARAREVGEERKRRRTKERYKEGDRRTEKERRNEDFKRRVDKMKAECCSLREATLVLVP